MELHVLTGGEMTQPREWVSATKPNTFELLGVIFP